MLLLISAIDFTSMLRLGKDVLPVLRFVLSYTLSTFESFIELMFMSIFLQTLTNSYKRLNGNISKVSYCDHSPPKSATIEAMEGLRVKHYELHSLATEANKIFGFPVLLSIANDFQAITGCLYVLWTSARGDSTDVSNGVAIGWSIVLLLHSWCLLKNWVELCEQVRIFLQPHELNATFLSFFNPRHRKVQITFMIFGTTM